MFVDVELINLTCQTLRVLHSNFYILIEYNGKTLSNNNLRQYNVIIIQPKYVYFDGERA